MIISKSKNFAKPLYNKVLSIMNNFPGPVIVEYMENNLDTTKG